MGGGETSENSTENNIETSIKTSNSNASNSPDLVQRIMNSSFVSNSYVQHILYGYEAAKMLDEKINRSENTESINSAFYGLKMDYTISDWRCHKKLVIITGALLYKESWKHPLSFLKIVSRGYARIIK